MSFGLLSFGLMLFGLMLFGLMLFGILLVYQLMVLSSMSSLPQSLLFNLLRLPYIRVFMWSFWQYNIFIFATISFPFCVYVQYIV